LFKTTKEKAGRQRHLSSLTRKGGEKEGGKVPIFRHLWIRKNGKRIERKERGGKGTTRWSGPGGKRLAREAAGLSWWVPQRKGKKAGSNVLSV